MEYQIITRMPREIWLWGFWNDITAGLKREPWDLIFLNTCLCMFQVAPVTI